MYRVYWKTWLRRVGIGVLAIPVLAVAVVLFLPAALAYELGGLVEEIIAGRH